MCDPRALSTAKPLRPTPGAAVGPARALVEEHGSAAQLLEVMARAAIVDGLEGGCGPPLLPVACLLYTSPSPRDRTRSRMPSSA